MGGFSLPDESLNAPLAFEAQAWDAVSLGDFNKAVQLSRRWLQDEPFTSRPALFGSLVASYALGDYPSAALLARSALTANPSDPSVIAQILYSEASAGRTQVAEALLPRLEEAINGDTAAHSRMEWDILVNADRGLIAFRKGDVLKGRQLYAIAMNQAVSRGLSQIGASALMNYVREEVLTGAPLAADYQQQLERALQFYPTGMRDIAARFVERIKDAAQQGQPV